MMGQAAPVYVVRPLTKQVEHLRKGKGHDEVIGRVGIADDEERRRPSVPHFVKLHLVIGHNLPELGDVKGGQPCPAGNQNAFCRLASDVL